MPVRSFVAIDSDNFVVSSSSNSGLVGKGIINNSDTPNGTVFQYSSGGGTTVTIDDRSGNPDIVEDDRHTGHRVIDGGGIVANGTGIEAESLIYVRALDADGNPTGPRITITVFSQNGRTRDIFGFSSDVQLQDGVSYVKVAGSNNGSTRYDNFVTCFGPGTLIDAPGGARPVEDFVAGDLVTTRDHGALPLRWIARRTVDGTNGFAPVRFAPGAIGNHSALLVSQQHRILIQHPVAELLFDTPEVLVAAKALCGLPGIDLGPETEITYSHLMFDSHQIVRSNGVWTESFFLGKNAVGGLDDAARAELTAMFPSLPVALSSFGPTMARTLTTAEAALLHSSLQRADALGSGLSIAA